LKRLRPQPAALARRVRPNSNFVHPSQKRAVKWPRSWRSQTPRQRTGGGTLACPRVRNRREPLQAAPTCSITTGTSGPGQSGLKSASLTWTTAFAARSIRWLEEMLIAIWSAMLDTELLLFNSLFNFVRECLNLLICGVSGHEARD